MSVRGLSLALVLSLPLWALAIVLVICTSRAFALDYEIWAERPGALLRADEPNFRRLGQPFPSRHDCLEAIALSKAEKGWRLRCRAAEAEPVPRLKANK